MAHKMTWDVKDWGLVPRMIISVFGDVQWIDTFGFPALLHFAFLTEGKTGAQDHWHITIHNPVTAHRSIYSYCEEMECKMSN